MANDPKRPDANEGEGSRTAAKKYNDRTRAFVKSGRVDESARDAEKAIDGPEAEALKKAVEDGKKHSHGEDPSVRRK